jgi:hypothetical protein
VMASPFYQSPALYTTSYLTCPPLPPKLRLPNRPPLGVPSPSAATQEHACGEATPGRAGYTMDAMMHRATTSIGLGTMRGVGGYIG